MNQQIGKYIIIAGIILILAGIFIYYFHGSLKWLGKLPGDIRVEGKNSRFYFPWVSMLIVSIVLILLINVIRKWF